MPPRTVTRWRKLRKPESHVEAVGGTAAVTLNYGAFLQTVVDFVIVALAIF
jgi:large-conductance mechanosensitive channel